MDKKDISQLIHTIKIRMNDYLTTEGISVSFNGKFKCPNSRSHRRNDSTPSAHFREDNDNGYPSWKCFTCSEHGDTINLASFIHGLPIDGPGFMLETIPFICEKLNIDITEYAQTDESIDMIKPNMELKKYLLEHKATPEALMNNTYGRNYPIEMAKQVIDKFPLLAISDREYNIDTDHVIWSAFRNRSLMIPLKQRGLIVATIGRAYGDIKPKYRNTIKDKAKEITYENIINLDDGVRAARKKGILFVFEGIFNTLVASTIGLDNSIGIMGTGINNIHKYVKDTKIYEIVLVLDNDSAGNDSTVRLTKELLNLAITTTIYRYGSKPFPQDCDDYDISMSLSPDEWTIHLDNPTNRMDIIEFICHSKLIYLSEKTTSPISRYELLLEDIAKYGSPLLARRYSQVIPLAFDDLEVGEENLITRINQVLKDAKSPIMNKMNIAANEIYDKIIKAKTLEEKTNLANKQAETFEQLSKVATMPIKAMASREFDELTDMSNVGQNIIYTTGYSNLDNGVGKAGRLVFSDSMLIGIAGKPGHCKSLLCRNIAINIAKFHKKDVMCLYLSIDDTSKRTMQWALSGECGIPYSDLVMGSEALLNNPRSSEAIENARNRLAQIYGESFLIFDKSKGGDLDSIINHIDTISNEYSNKQLVVFLDNMYNVNEIARSGGDKAKRSATDTVIDVLKEQCANRNTTICTTLEVVKNTTGRLVFKDLKETGSVEYRTDMILTMFNSSKEFGDNSLMFKEDNMGNKTPIIEIESLRVKTGESRKIYYMYLNGPTGTMTPILDQEEINYCETRRDSDIKNNRPKYNTNNNSSNTNYSAGGSIS